MGCLRPKRRKRTQKRCFGRGYRLRDRAGRETEHCRVDEQGYAGGGCRRTGIQRVYGCQEQTWSSSSLTAAAAREKEREECRESWKDIRGR